MNKVITKRYIINIKDKHLYVSSLKRFNPPIITKLRLGIMGFPLWLYLFSSSFWSWNNMRALFFLQTDYPKGFKRAFSN